MESTKAKTIVYWIVTALFCLQMSFTAYAELRLPQVAEAFTHLGFPAYFRVELSWAKLLGVAMLFTNATDCEKSLEYARRRGDPSCSRPHCARPAGARPCRRRCRRCPPPRRR